MVDNKWVINPSLPSSLDQKKGVKTANNWWEVTLSLLDSCFHNNKFKASNSKQQKWALAHVFQAHTTTTSTVDSKWESTHDYCIYQDLVLQSWITNGHQSMSKQFITKGQEIYTRVLCMADKQVVRIGPYISRNLCHRAKEQQNHNKKSIT